jgi:hypothetical protein
MLFAKFYINPNPDFPNMPCFSFLNEEEREKYSMLGEIAFCDKDYIIEDVLPNLSKVMSGELPEYEFGYDATIIDFYKDKSVINYNYFEGKLEIPSEDLYRFMREWGDYLIKWKQNTKSQA